MFELSTLLMPNEERLEEQKRVERLGIPSPHQKCACSGSVEIRYHLANRPNPKRSEPLLPLLTSVQNLFASFRIFGARISVHGRFFG